MIELHNKGTLLSIRVKTQSKKQVIIFTGEVCNVHVKSPPVRGQANIEVVKLVAKRLNIPPNRVRIITGKKSSNKVLLIEDMDPQSVTTALKVDKIIL